MRHGVKVLGVVAVAGLAAAAQAFPPPGGPHHGGGPMGPHAGGPPGGHAPAPDGRKAAMLLAIAADADASRDVTAGEWTAFLATLDADGDGVVSLDALAAALPLPAGAVADTTKRDEMLTRAFDQDGDGSVTIADLNALFALLDADADGALAESELAPPDGRPGPRPGPGAPHEGGDCQVGDPQRAGALLARAADADDDRTVTADEWTAFLASLGAADDDVVSFEALAAALPAPPHAPPAGADTTRRDAALLRAFDYDGDGAIEISDLQSLFDALDADDDGAASRAEAKPPKPLRGGEKRAAMALFRAADSDASRDVSADEWTAFLDGLAVDDAGAVSLDDLASKLPAPRHAPSDTAKRDAALTKAFDRDGDGVVTKADLQAIFDTADANADGALDPTELHRRR